MSYTHRVRRDFVAFGRLLRASELVDASAWPNPAKLERTGYLVPLPPQPANRAVGAADPAPSERAPRSNRHG